MPTAIVSGGSRGIGDAICRVLAKEGYKVVICYNNSQEKAELLKKEILSNGGDALIFKLDVTNSQEIAQLVNQIVATHGVDVLVNNAGISLYKMLQDTTDADWDNVMDVNLKGMFLLSRAIAPYMISNKMGKIINISSVWGVNGGSLEVAYSASKGGVIAFTKALAKELAPSNINVNCIAPGVIETDMLSSLSSDDIAALIEATPIGRLGKPIDIANAVAFLSSEKASFITAGVIEVNGGF